MCSSTGYLMQANENELHQILAKSRSISDPRERNEFLLAECDGLKKRYNIDPSAKVSIYDLDHKGISLFVLPAITDTSSMRVTSLR